jgi:ankyrin repeat protein
MRGIAVSPLTSRLLCLVAFAAVGCDRSNAATHQDAPALPPKAEVQLAKTPDALVDRAFEGDIAAVTALLDAGVNPNQSNKFGALPLMTALAVRKGEVAKVLVERGAHSWPQDDKWSPLMFAAFIGERPVVEAMLARDANVTAKNAQGMTALMFAASRGHSEIVSALASKGSEVDARDVNGLTALMFSANNGHSETARALLAVGASADIKSESGQTAAAFARTNGFKELAALLQPSGVPSR